MQKMNIPPKVILSGRSINDEMGKIVAKRTLNLLKLKNKIFNNLNILVLGFAFKENCTDFRNTKVIDIVKYLVKKTATVDVCDYLIDINQAKKLYKFKLYKDIPKKESITQ